jgi:hypothetical protein
MKVLDTEERLKLQWRIVAASSLTASHRLGKAFQTKLREPPGALSSYQFCIWGDQSELLIGLVRRLKTAA